MKTLTMILSFSVLTAEAAPLQVPNLKIEQSLALDMYCPTSLAGSTLSPVQLALIPKLPAYASELAVRVPFFQSEWDARGPKLLATAAEIVGKPFEMRDLQAAVFLCPSLPFMGTPLAFNVTSYVAGTAKEIGLAKPTDVFYFVSTAFHEILHKYIDDILEKRPSAVLARTKDSALYESHLHLFALQKRAFEKAGLGSRLWEIQYLEASHGEDYARAWKAVHGDPKLEAELIAELTN